MATIIFELKLKITRSHPWEVPRVEQWVREWILWDDGEIDFVDYKI